MGSNPPKFDFSRFAPTIHPHIPMILNGLSTAVTVLCAIGAELERVQKEMESESNGAVPPQTPIGTMDVR